MPEYTRSVSALPLGTTVSRFIRAVVEGDNLPGKSLQIAEGWLDTPLVAEAFRLRTKAAIPPGTTSDATWASPLVQTGISTEVLTLMRDQSILAALEPRCRQVPFRMQIPVDVSSVKQGAWAGEGVPIAVNAQTFATLPPLDPLKAGVIVVVTRELIQCGIPTAEAMIQKAAIGGLSMLLDFSFLDPALAAAPGSRPASITNGATAVTQTGVTAATIGADLAAMTAAITTPGEGLTWIMQKKTLATIAGALPLNYSATSKTLNGLPVLTSNGSPQQITLVDASTIVIADEGDFDVAKTKDATLQLNTAPDNPVNAGTVLVSLLQTNSVGIRIIRTINWERAVAGAVSYMVTTY